MATDANSEDSQEQCLRHRANVSKITILIRPKGDVECDIPELGVDVLDVQAQQPHRRLIFLVHPITYRVAKMSQRLQNGHVTQTK